MTAPTPGPWEVVDDVRVFPVERGSLIAECSIPLDNDPETDEEWESPEVKTAYETAHANSRLIAAAPELLAALKLAYDWSRFVAASGMTNTEEFIAELFERGEAVQEAARAAIKKAEGKP